MISALMNGTVGNSGEAPFFYLFSSLHFSFIQSEKKQNPAWCDRILWKFHRGDIRKLEYTSVQDLYISDHKPIYGIFETEV